MSFGDWTGAVQNVVQVVAIVVGAGWAYYKFVRGRTFHRRAEVSLDASLLAAGATVAILARATLQNTGGADIPLRLKAVKVRAFRRGDIDDRGRPQWRDVVAAPVFDDHRWLESQETISDDVLVPLRAEDTGDDVLAYRISCLIYEQRKDGGICWTTNTIVPKELKEG
jgi:hypothetical protein